MKYILSILSYGDFIIDYNCANQAEILNFTFIITPQIERMINELSINVNYLVIEYEMEVPPNLFSIKKNGLLKAVKSLILLNKSFKKIIKSYNLSMKNIYFKNNSIKYYLIAFPFLNINYISEIGSNIYQSYSNKFNFEFKYSSIKNLNFEINIYPESRQQFKNIPKELLKRILEMLDFHKLKYNIIVYTEYYNNLYSDNFIKVTSLCEMVDSANSKMIITADTFIMHYAELIALEIFVFSPNENIEYFTPSILKNKSWSLFSEKLDNFNNWLKKCQQYQI